jgi:hypothetical protein
MNFADIAQLAGHSTPAVTSSVYGHATIGLHERAASALADALATKTATKLTNKGKS